MKPTDEAKIREWLALGKWPAVCPFLQGYLCLRQRVCNKRPELYECDDSVYKAYYSRRLKVQKAAERV